MKYANREYANSLNLYRKGIVLVSRQKDKYSYAITNLINNFQYYKLIGTISRRHDLQRNFFLNK